MAEAKKTVTVKPAAKAVAKKAEEKKAAAAVEVKETAVKETAKKEVVKKAPAKKETVKKEAVKKAPAKKAETKTAAKKETAKKAPAKKAAVSEVVNVQFAGKSYTTEELVKIAKDVWKYDLGKKEEDFKTVELYVKPEESLAYYVINGDVTGNFAI